MKQEVMFVIDGGVISPFLLLSFSQLEPLESAKGTTLNLKRC